MKTKTIVSFLSPMALLAFRFASAATNLPGKEITAESVKKTITGIACWLVGIVMAVMVIFLIWSGIRFLMARGDPTKLKSAKANLNTAILGVLVILATNVIIASIAKFLDVTYSFIPLRCSGN